MFPYAIESIAKYYSRTEIGIEKRLDAEMIPHAKQALLNCIPYSKREIAEQVIDTIFTPASIRSEQQLDVCDSALDVFASRIKFCNQFFLRVYARVGNDPDLAVKGEGLVFA